MIRVAIVSDSHWDTSSRWEECLRIHDWIAGDIMKRDAHLLLHAGDVFERKSNPQERLAVVDWLQKVSGHCPVVMVKGNHDAVGDIEIFNRIAHDPTGYPIEAIETAAVHIVSTREGPVNVACVAWPRKAQLLAQLGEVSPEVAEQSAGDALRNLLRGLGTRMQNLEGPKILLMHAMVRGSKVSTGQPLVGCDMEIGIDDLGLVNADFYALGHIHMPQEWEWNGAPIAYPGSPRRTSYGETEEKGYILTEFQQDGTRWECRWKRVPTPCAEMFLVEGTYNPENEILFDFKTEIPERAMHDGAEIRFRYYVQTDQRDAAKVAAIKHQQAGLRNGAVDFKIEEVVIPQTRARTPDIATAQTLGDKLNVLWKSRNVVPEPPRAERLLTKLNDIETEARNAA